MQFLVNKTIFGFEFWFYIGVKVLLHDDIHDGVAQLRNVNLFSCNFYPAIAKSDKNILIQSFIP